jgi:hypothetical protein
MILNIGKFTVIIKNIECYYNYCPLLPDVF